MRVWVCTVLLYCCPPALPVASLSGWGFVMFAFAEARHSRQGQMTWLPSRFYNRRDSLLSRICTHKTKSCTSVLICHAKQAVHHVRPREIFVGQNHVGKRLSCLMKPKSTVFRGSFHTSILHALMVVVFGPNTACLPWRAYRTLSLTALAT